VKSATYFVSLLDFSQPGELGVFIDEAQVANLEKKMNERGFSRAPRWRHVQPAARERSRMVVRRQHYLMGKDPFPFDLLYWNADSTRMPARMHSFYLRNMYLKEPARRAGGIQLKGVPIDLGAVPVPSYFISTVGSHRALEDDVQGPRAISAARCASSSAARATSRHRNPRPRRSTLLGQATRCADAGRVVRRREQTPAHVEDWQPAGSTASTAGRTKVPARYPPDAIEDAPAARHAAAAEVARLWFFAARATRAGRTPSRGIVRSASENKHLPGLPPAGRAGDRACDLGRRPRRPTSVGYAEAVQRA